MDSTLNDSAATETMGVTKREQPVASKKIQKTSSSKKKKSGGGRVMSSSQGSSQGEGGRSKKKSKREAFSMYIYKVLKQVHHDKGITTSSMQIMNSMMNDLMERIAAEAAKLLMLNKRNTLSAREIQTAVKLVIRGELAAHAVSEGTKAMANYDRNKDK